jgi:GNAT superfamily N-acetyltransferase
MAGNRGCWGGTRAAPEQCTLGRRTQRINGERTLFDAGGISLGSPAERGTLCSLRVRSIFVIERAGAGIPDWRRAMSIRVRPPKSEDRPMWLTLFKGYIEFYQATVPDDVIDTLWQRVMEGGEGFPIALLAVDATDRPVGLAHVLYHRSTWTRGWYCYLEDLFVDPHERGKGIGRALIEAVYAHADAHGCSRTYWMTQETNATARALYDKVAAKSAFVQYRREPKAAIVR